MWQVVGLFWIVSLGLGSPRLEAGVSLFGSILYESSSKPVGNAVLWMKIPGHKPTRKLKLESMVQRGKELIPRVMVAPTQTEVYFPNEDPIFHNIFSFNKIKKLDLGNYKGKGRPIVFEEAGVYPIGCSIHPWMSAYILIVDTPFFSKTSALGNYSLKGLRPGEHTIHLWAADFKKTLTQTVILKDGVNSLDWAVPASEVKKKRRRRKRKKSKRGYSSGY